MRLITSIALLTLLAACETSSPSGPDKEPPPLPAQPTPPAAPSGLTAEATPEGAIFRWQPAATDAQHPVFHYFTELSPAEPGAEITVSGTTATVIGLRTSTRYRLTVSATNDIGLSPAAVSPEVTPLRCTTRHFDSLWRSHNGPSYPTAVVTADFDEDGRPDLALTEYGGDIDPANDGVWLLRGKGDGSFAEAGTLASGNTPNALLTADFNGDQHVDLAVGNYRSRSVSVFLGRGDGTFEPKRDVAVGELPGSLAAGHLNADGKLDLVVLNRGSHDLTVLLGAGDGTFTAGNSLNANGVSLSALALADLNEDGKTDVVATLGAGTQVLGVFRGKGDGTFEPASYQDGNQYATAMAAADFDQDGHVDLALTDYDTEVVTLWRGNGSGGFLSKTPFTVGILPDAVTAMDVNADGKLDLLVGTGEFESLSVLAGNGAGDFAAPQRTFAGSGPESIIAADFDSDGWLDVASIDSSGLGLMPSLCTR